MKLNGVVTPMDFHHSSVWRATGRPAVERRLVAIQISWPRVVTRNSARSCTSLGYALRVIHQLGVEFIFAHSASAYSSLPYQYHLLNGMSSGNSVGYILLSRRSAASL